jgi:hypothetical protein
MPGPRVELNRRGARELLGDPGVLRELERIAQRVAARVDGAHVEPARTGGYRAVAHVVDDRPGAIAREADTGALARALDGSA